MGETIEIQYLPDFSTEAIFQLWRRLNPEHINCDHDKSEPLRPDQTKPNSSFLDRVRRSVDIGVRSELQTSGIFHAAAAFHYENAAPHQIWWEKRNDLASVCNLHGKFKIHSNCCHAHAPKHVWITPISNVSNDFILSADFTNVIIECWAFCYGKRNCIVLLKASRAFAPAFHVQSHHNTNECSNIIIECFQFKINANFVYMRLVCVSYVWNARNTCLEDNITTATNVSIKYAFEFDT